MPLSRVPLPLAARSLPCRSPDDALTTTVDLLEADLRLHG